MEKDFLNRKLWEMVGGLVSFNYYPSLPCPYCNNCSLKIQKDTFLSRPLSGIALDLYVKKFGERPGESDSNASEPNWVALVKVLNDSFQKALNQPSQFVAFFKCEFCSESVSSMGFASEPMPGFSGEKKIKVEWFNPPLPIFPLREFVPGSINGEILRSFHYFHSDLCSSGNRMRRAIERFCEELGHGKGSLHRSILSLKKEYQEEGGWLEALKLVGNEATHSDGVVERDLLDSYEILSLSLEVFNRKNVKERASNIVARLGTKYRGV